MIVPALLLVLVALALTVCGVILVLQGLCRRRHGDTPHCRKCDYNLTGLTGEKCPECGHALWLNGVVRGEGSRSPGRVVGGLLCLMPLVLGLVMVAANIDWYPYIPAAWLISNTQSTNTITARNAWKELDRRSKAGELSAGQRSKLIDAGLKQQALSASGVATTEMVEYLGAALLNGQLSPAQQETFYKQIAVLTLRVRPKVILGDDVPYVVIDRGQTPSTGFWMRLGTTNKMIDGKIVEPDVPGGGAASGMGGGANTSGSVPIHAPGRHTLSFNRRIAFYAGPFNQEDQSTLLRELTIPLRADFELLPTAPPDLIKVIREPALTQTVQSCVSIEELKYQTQPAPRVSWSILIKSPPVTVAFEVLLRINGREYAVGSIYRQQGDSVQWGSSKGWWGDDVANAPPPFTACDVILRSSEKAVRESIDLFEYWEGELVYKDVPVTLETPATQPASQ